MVGYQYQRIRTGAKHAKRPRKPTNRPKRRRRKR